MRESEGSQLNSTRVLTLSGGLRSPKKRERLESSWMSLVLILALLGWLISDLAQAQESVLQLPSLEAEKAVVADPLVPTVPSPFDANLKFLSTHYVRSNTMYFREDAESQISSLQLDVVWRKKAKYFNEHIHLGNKYNASEEANYIKPYEFYVEKELSDQHKVGVGRKLVTWSEADRFWSQGLWQPRFIDDKMRIEEAGLSGAFYQLEKAKWNFTFMYLPIFIPDMGPQFKSSDGKFVSGSPWFRPPPESVKILNVSTPIQYSLEEPSKTEILNHPGVASKLEIKNKNGYSRVAYAYKPVNQLLLGFPFYLGLAQPGVSVDIDINCRVIYHHLVTVERNLNLTNQSSLLLSSTYESPNRDDTPASWITQETKEAVVAQALWQKQFDSSSWLRRYYFGLLNLWGGDAPDRGEIATERTFFERRYQFQRAVTAGFDWPVGYIKGIALLASARAQYDLQQQGGVVTSDLSYQYNPQWTFLVSADVIGLTNDSNSDINDGFLGLYRANDRFMAGVNYVF